MAVFGVSLARPEFARLVCAPAGEQTVLGCRHAQRVQLVQHQRADADEQSLLAPQGAGRVGSDPRDQAQKEHVQQGQTEHDQAERGVVRHHEGEEHDAHAAVDQRAEKPLGQAGGDPVDGTDARRQLTGQPVAEVVHRESQQF